MFCQLVVLVRLSVPVQVIDWKDSEMTCNVLMGTLNPTHSLTSDHNECNDEFVFCVSEIDCKM